MKFDCRAIVYECLKIGMWTLYMFKTIVWQFSAIREESTTIYSMNNEKFILIHKKLLFIRHDVTELPVWHFKQNVIILWSKDIKKNITPWQIVLCFGNPGIYFDGVIDCRRSVSIEFTKIHWRRPVEIQRWHRHHNC